MLCQICHLKEATIKLTQIINDTKKEINLCKSCAEEKGFTNPLSSFPQLFSGIILGLLGEESMATKKVEKNRVRCSGCNMTMSDFEKTGLLGCAECYQTFSEELKVILRRIHGSNKHIGSRPMNRRTRVPQPDLNKLRKELNLAIKKEQYERAAELRDLIRDVERELNS
ncbi:MAG: UvrB/UvrC motif-containing protein [candidate division KSB1 bacterium]|nr:UvrB/UvrC motif-containing protein [candidate division KSB1 bacterium]